MLHTPACSHVLSSDLSVALTYRSSHVGDVLSPLPNLQVPGPSLNADDLQGPGMGLFLTSQDQPSSSSDCIAVDNSHICTATTKSFQLPFLYYSSDTKCIVGPPHPQIKPIADGSKKVTDMYTM